MLSNDRLEAYPTELPCALAGGTMVSMKKASESQQPERFRTEFTREGGYYVLVMAFVLTGAMLRDINLMMVIAGLLAGLWLYNWRRASATLRKLAVRRSCPETVCAGDLLVVDVEAKNLTRRQVKRGVVVSDTVSRLVGRKTAEATSGRVVFDRIPAGRTETRSYQGRIWTRGRYELGPLELSCGFPFGLMRRRGKIPNRHRLTVYPRLGRLTPAWSRLHDDALVGAQRIRRQRSRTQGDFYGLRDWREGDSHRWIHWRTSARRDKLVVRQYERQRRHDVVLLLDLWQPRKATDSQRDAIELTISFAATVLADLCRRGGSQVHLHVGGRDRASVRGIASQGLLGEMLSALAVAQASDADPLPDIFAEALQSAPRGARLVVLSTRALDVNSLAARAPIPESAMRLLVEVRTLSIDCSSRELDEYFNLA